MHLALRGKIFRWLRRPPVVRIIVLMTLHTRPATMKLFVEHFGCQASLESSLVGPVYLVRSTPMALVHE